VIQVLETIRNPVTLKGLQQYFDEKGFLCHFKVDEADNVIQPIEFDGGDSLMRIGVWLKMKELGQQPIMFSTNKSDESTLSPRLFFFYYVESNCLSLGVRTEQAEITRHWNKNEWFGKPGTLSRDNFLPILCFALETEMLSWSNHWFKVLKRRWFMMWNVKKIGQQTEKKKIPDFLGASGFALYARLLIPQTVFGRFGLWVMKHVSDSILVGSSIVKVIGSYLDRENTGDTLNLSNVLDTLSRHKPTWQVWISVWILRTFLHRHSKFPNETRVMSHWCEYFMRDEAPPLDQLVKSTKAFVFNV